MSERRGLRLLVTVTFNPNQLRAHLEPILDLPEVEAVTLVADVPAPPLPKLTTVVPSPRLVRVLGRAAAKTVTCVQVAKREQPDWAISYNLVPHGLNGRAASRWGNGCRTMYHQIGGPVEWLEGGWRSDNGILGRLPRRSRLLEALLLRSVRRNTVVVAMGGKGRQGLVDHGVEDARAVVVPPSIDDARFVPAPDTPKPYDLVSVGALIPTKQMHVVIEAAARLRERLPGLRAAIVGEGPLEAELRALAAERGVADAVDFLGFRRDVEAVYRDARAFVLASRYEGLSIALLEAMASGLPAFVSDVGELRDAVRDGENGWAFPSGDVDRLVELLDPVLREPALAARLGERGAADARALASRAAVSARYAELLARA